MVRVLLRSASAISGYGDLRPLSDHHED